MRPSAGLRFTSTLLLCASLVLIASCGDDGSDGDGPTASPDETGSPVETPAGVPGDPEECTVSDEDIGLVSKLDFAGDGEEFSQGGQFASGDEVRARMRLINCTGQDTMLYFDTTQRYELTIELDDPLTEVYRSSEGVVFADTAGTEVLGPGDTIVYEETWDQTDQEGAQVGPGIYRVSFLSVGCGDEAAVDCPPFGPIARIEILE